MDAIGIATVSGAIALGHLARAHGTVRVRDIAASCALPAPYLARIVRQPARAGIVTTTRG